MSLRATVALAATLAILAPAAPGATLRAQSARGLRYTFTVKSADDRKPTRGTVQASGDRARIDLERERGDSDSWILVTNGGRTVQLVNPREREYAEMDADRFAGLVGTVMHALDKVMTLDVDDATVDMRRLGAGGTIAGYPTERWALTQEFVVNVGVLGHTSAELHRVVTDYWIAPGLELPRNPLVELITQTETALAQADDDFMRLTAERRRALPRGAPLRIVVTSASSDADRMTAKAPKVSRLDVTDISTNAPVDADALQVPAGYRKKDGMKGLSFSF